MIMVPSPEARPISAADLIRSQVFELPDATVIRMLERYCESQEVQFPPEEISEWLGFVDWARTRPPSDIIASNGTVRHSKPISDSTLAVVLKRIDRILKRLAIRSLARDQRVQELQSILALRHRGFRREKHALMPEELLKVVRACDKSSLPGKRCEAALLLLFMLAGRISELLRLTVRDLSFVDGFGLIVCIRLSKMNISSTPEFIKVPFARNRELCAVRAVREWLEQAHITDGLVFPSFTRNAHELRSVSPTSTAFYRMFARAYDRAGVNALGVGTHGLRRGNITVRAIQKQSLKTIAAHARHKDEKMMWRYIDRSKFATPVDDRLNLP